MDDLIGQPARHQGGRKGPNWTACEAPRRHQGGRKGPIGQSVKHQGGTREAEKDHLDSLGGTREAPGPVKTILCYEARTGLEPLGFGVLPFLGLIKCYICV